MDGSAANEHVQLMSNPSELAKYDILFFNCGMTEDWMWSGSNVGQNLRDYVNGGGSIYASDMAYYVLEETFPSAVSFVGNDSTPGAAYVGEMGYVQGDVVDETMKAVLGKDVAEINYDLPSWAAIESAQPGTPLIRGSYQYYDMNSMDYSVMTQTGPLAVRYESGAGVFLYTSFHNEAQATQDMDAILREFVLSL